MKISARLQQVAEDGLIDEVLRPLKSGKEADVFLVRCSAGDMTLINLRRSPSRQ